MIDYHSERFEGLVKGIDVVFDAVGGETLERSWGVLGPKGRLITIVSGDEAQDDRTKSAFFIVEPNRPQLIEIASLLERREQSRWWMRWCRSLKPPQPMRSR